MRSRRRPLFAGCQGIGPRTVEADRIDYSTSITESWKQQTLLNIVKLRYADPPLFVDVGQIVAGYSLETAVNVGAADQDSPLGGGSTFSLGGSGRFTDRPTITYVPLTGNAFVNGLITPIPPVSLFSAIQAGWPADSIVRLGVSVINGISNEQFTGGSYSPADPMFSRVIELLRELQQSGALSIRVERAARAARPRSSRCETRTYRRRSRPSLVSSAACWASISSVPTSLGLWPHGSE